MSKQIKFIPVVKSIVYITIEKLPYSIVSVSDQNHFLHEKQSGLVGGLETLCGQAYGAGQYKKLGVYTYSAIISLNLVCIPVSVLWIFMDKLLILIGQDPSISLEARNYSVLLIPSLFGCAVLKPLIRYLQSQSLIFPMLISSFLVLCFHAPLCWAFIFKLKFAILGAAVSFNISSWLYVILLVFYIKCSSSCKNTCVPFSKNAFIGIGEFFRFAVPSAVMVCTRVSNELGAGNPQAARVAVCAVMFLAVLETLIVSVTIYCFRYIWGHAYSNEMAVVDYISEMTPLICLSTVTDSLQAVISGIARGCGWQHIGAYINLGAFYLLGIPVAVVLGFVLRLNAKGFWIGIVIGSTVQSIVLSIVTASMDWQEQATKAKERISGGRDEVENVQY
ncbi:hypothetical protein RJ639_020269 [Escallonia herrerae]|uniref:Uncharacterized protein n=1 Tax=Escallonia herrerae TaxID=1293975 RepID=A0AA88V4D2_9ASTE|nr:hypothetical protein RJ639_020269 [Escallonia herrerae]